jgi:hypothetical protein
MTVSTVGNAQQKVSSNAKQTRKHWAWELGDFGVRVRFAAEMVSNHGDKVGAVRYSYVQLGTVGYS